MPIHTIFFDVGGTLIHPDLSRLLAPLLARVTPTAGQFAIAERAAKYAGHANGDAAPAKTPNTSHWHVYFQALLQAVGCGLDLLPELTARAGKSHYWTQVDPAAVGTLERLKRHYRLAVISNADGRIREVLARAGMAGLFDEIIDSGLVGCEKPDPRIFRAGLQAMNANPAQSLYVGDLYTIDYRGATGVGMHALLLDPQGIYDGWQAPRLASLQELPEWVAAQS
jgi:putative hydrolase of the HAD superfamily